jgi:drug/metabolite transporter (DMT)-like permease
VARGVAPLLVTALAIPAAGEIPSPSALSGVGLICAGLLVFALERGRIGQARAKPLLLAATAGVVLSAYTVVDGLGVRSGDAAFAYVAWLFVLDGATMIVIARIWRGAYIYTALRHRWKTGIALGVISTVNFCIVLWALSFVAMGPVAAIRETSVVFAALIGAFFMGESFGLRRISASILIAAGIFIMNL